MSIKMKALGSFLGAEGLIQSGEEFNVKNPQRAKDLENKKLAVPYETQTAEPAEQPNQKPNYNQTVTPDQAPDESPSETKSLEDWSIKELREKAKEIGVKGYTKKIKSDLIDAIRARGE